MLGAVLAGCQPWLKNLEEKAKRSSDISLCWPYGGRNNANLTSCISLLGLPYKVAQSGRLKQQKFISLQFWRLSPRSVCWQGWFLPRSPSLACRWPSSLIYSHGLPSVCFCVLISSSYKDTSHIGLESTLMTSFQLKNLISSYSHILRYWGGG